MLFSDTVTAFGRGNGFTEIMTVVFNEKLNRAFIINTTPADHGTPKSFKHKELIGIIYLSPRPTLGRRPGDLTLDAR